MPRRPWPRRVEISFSPVSSIMISDTEQMPPGTRTAPLQSTPSRSSIAMARLAMSSSASPIGPA